MSNDAKKIVEQILEKKYKVLFVMIWITLIMYIGSPLLIGVFNNKDATMILAPICGLSGTTFFIIAIWYFSFTFPVNKAVKTLVRTNKLDYANEIISGDYNANDRVGFSKHLFYDKKKRIMVAYDDIVWIYKHPKDRYNTEFLFCTIDGKKHGSKIDELTLAEFLKRRSGILTGNTPQNKAIYKIKVKNFKITNNK